MNACMIYTRLALWGCCAAKELGKGTSIQDTVIWAFWRDLCGGEVQEGGGYALGYNSLNYFLFFYLEILPRI